MGCDANRRQGGTWAQGECVFIEGAGGSFACDEYRRRMAQARIAVITANPDAILTREIAVEKRRVQAECAALTDAIGEAYSLLGAAPDDTPGVANARRRLLDALGRLEDRPSPAGREMLERLQRLEERENRLWLLLDDAAQTLDLLAHHVREEEIGPLTHSRRMAAAETENLAGRIREELNRPRARA
jgi:hypothetical protein